MCTGQKLGKDLAVILGNVQGGNWMAGREEEAEMKDNLNFVSIIYLPQQSCKINNQKVSVALNNKHLFFFYSLSWLGSSFDPT